MFSKAVNGTYYVVEAVPDTSKHMTYITSAYMTKNKPTGVQSADAFAPTLTAKPEADLPVGTQGGAECRHGKPRNAPFADRRDGV